MNLNGRLAVFVRDDRVLCEPRYGALMKVLQASGVDAYSVKCKGDITEGTAMLLSAGGDGTFLSAASLVGDSGLPILGVNFGRLGFLSENKPEDIYEALMSGEYDMERRSLLKADIVPMSDEHILDGWPYALNEFTVHRSGAATLGVIVSVDGTRLPVFWSDGLVVATSSGSTAYSLSVGGPIVLPESKVLIISPIAPHNLNVRPIIIPDTSVVEIGFISRDGSVLFTADNRNVEISADTVIKVSMAGFSLNRVRLKSSNFINALTGKLFWGEDIRNGNGQY